MKMSCFFKTFASSASKPFPCENRMSGPRRPYPSRIFGNDACPVVQISKILSHQNEIAPLPNTAFLATWVVINLMPIFRTCSYIATTTSFGKKSKSKAHPRYTRPSPNGCFAASSSSCFMNQSGMRSMSGTISVVHDFKRGVKL